jgi:NTP pyrophosphatase (non-canonical NTP hydrolase)/predicted aspartyl protease
MDELTLDRYQRDAILSKDCPDNPFYYALGLTGEAGEVADKLKKFWRDKYYTYATEINEANVGTRISRDDIVIAGARRLLTYEDRDAIRKELGDTLWYIAAIADSLGMSLSEVAYQNLSKCKKRVETGTIHGEGDDREETPNNQIDWDKWAVDAWKYFDEIKQQLIDNGFTPEHIGKLSIGEAINLINKSAGIKQQLIDDGFTPEYIEKLSIGDAINLIDKSTEIKQQLIDNGFTPEYVEKLSIGEAINLINKSKIS